MPQVSVIIPTWNRKEMLTRAVESVLAQKGVSLEVLVCDNGSDDGTVAMAAAWKDPRVRLVLGPGSGGPAAPRNRGIAAAKGEWLAFLDDDDEWLKDKLSRQLEAALRENCLASCTEALRKISDTKIEPRLVGPLPQRIGFADLVSGNRVVNSSALIHSSLFPHVEGFPEDISLRAYEDYALWLRVACFTSFAAVDDALVMYRDMPRDSLRAFEPDKDRKLQTVYSDCIRWSLKHTEGRRQLSSLLKRKISLYAARFSPRRILSPPWQLIKRLKKRIAH